MLLELFLKVSLSYRVVVIAVSALLRQIKETTLERAAFFRLVVLSFHGLNVLSLSYVNIAGTTANKKCGKKENYNYYFLFFRRYKH